jgi:hypothetical protein
MPTKSIRKEDLVKLGVSTAMGVSRRRVLAENPELPERLVRELKRVQLGQHEYRRLLSSALENAALECLASFRADLRAGKVSPSTKPIAAGIFLDKAHLIGSRAAIQVVNATTEINDYGAKSKEEIMEALLLPKTGDAVESVAMEITPLPEPQPLSHRPSPKALRSS